MEFNEKLQELRKSKGLTQEGLAEALYVSRTAISKWESGRGYPGIDSLKAIAKFFSVTVDDLLSGDELLCVAENDAKEKESHLRDLSFGLLDVGMALYFFLPLFRQIERDTIEVVSLTSLSGTSLYMRIAYFAVVLSASLLGLITLAMQNCTLPLWTKSKRKISLALSAAGTLLFIISLQPYAAAFMFVFLIIKGLMAR